MHAHTHVYKNPYRQKRMKRLQKMDGLKQLLVCLTVSSMFTNIVHGRDPVLHEVGGDHYCWKTGVNFSDWSSHQHFYVGDWLYFGFDKKVYSVLEVNESSYEKCIDTDFITNITRGGRDVFELKETKTYYFISGRGFCFQGMHVAVNVIDIPPAPAPSPVQNSSSSPFNYWSLSLSLSLMLLLLPTSPFWVLFR